MQHHCQIPIKLETNTQKSVYMDIDKQRINYAWATQNSAVDTNVFFLFMIAKMNIN